MAVNNEVLALVLGGGRGSRLFPLTQHRSKPAVPIGGKYRLIDIPISTCLHADIRRIFVLTQFNSASLNRHISQAFHMDLFSQGFVDILAAEQTPEKPNRDRLAEIGQSIPQGATFGGHTPDKPFVASMGVYVFSRDVLLDAIEQ